MNEQTKPGTAIEANLGPQAIGFVSSAEGATVVVIGADGVLRELNPGDPVRDGDLLQVTEGSQVVITFADGSVRQLSSDDGQLRISHSNYQQLTEVEAGEENPEFAELLAALEEGRDITEVLEETAAGGEGGGGGDSIAGAAEFDFLNPQIQATSGIDPNLVPPPALDPTADTNEFQGEPAAPEEPEQPETSNRSPVAQGGSLAVAEEGLSNGNPDNTGVPTDTTNATTGSGGFAASDPDGDLLTYTLATTETGLSSGGQAIIFSGNGSDTLIGTIDNGATTILTITVDGAGNVNATLSGAVDHPDSGGEDILNLNIILTASDGEFSDSAAVTLAIEDDSPVIDLNPAGTDPVSVAEGGSIDDGSWSHGTGADQTGSQIIVNVAGDSTDYALDSDINTAVGTLRVNSDGSWTFAAADGLDQDDNPNLSFTVTVSDGDNDLASDSHRIAITDANVPQGAEDSADPVDEEGLAGGIAGGDGDVAGEDASVSGNLSYDFGGDGAATTDAFSWQTSGLPTLTAAGAAVSYSLSADGQTLTATAAGEDVFRLSLTDQATGAYTFTLLQPLDHSSNNDEDNIDFSFGYQLTDADGSTATGSLAVSVDDDTPVVYGAEYTRIEAAAATEIVRLTGDLYFASGADAPASYQFDYAYFDTTHEDALGLPVYDGSGSQLTASGLPVYFAVYGTDGLKFFGDDAGDIPTTTRLFGVTYDADANGGAGEFSHPAFMITLNSDGTYTMTALTPFDQSSENTDIDLTAGISGGNAGSYALGVTKQGNQIVDTLPTDQNGDPIPGTSFSTDNVFLTPLADDPDATINSRNDGLGVGASGGGGLYIREGEGINVEFVGNYLGDVSSDGLSRDDFVETADDIRYVNNVTLTMGATSAGDDATLIVRIDGLTEEWQFRIESDDATDITWVAAENGWVVEGMAQGDIFTIIAQEPFSKFSAAWFDGASVGDQPDTGNAGFLFAGLSYDIPGEGDIIDLNFDYTVTDADGDTSVGTIALSIDPRVDVQMNDASSSYTVPDGEEDNFTVYGDAQDNTITGNTTNEVLYGADGDDTLIGLQGSDILTGGAGADTFVWQAGDETGAPADVVTDFNIQSEGDVLNLADLLDGATNDTLGNYLSAVDNGNGGVDVGVDVDGDGSGYTDLTITLSGMTVTDFNNLVAGQDLIVE